MEHTTIAQIKQDSNGAHNNSLDKIGFKWSTQQQLNTQIKQDSYGAHNNSLIIR